jgi:hypothetical protein
VNENLQINRSLVKIRKKYLGNPSFLSLMEEESENRSVVQSERKAINLTYRNTLKQQQHVKSPR